MVVSRVVILTSVWTSRVVPVAKNLPIPLEINVLPGKGVAFVSLEVNLKSLLPDLILTWGVGVALGSLIHIAPIKSPKLSETNLTLATLAWAPLVNPLRTILVGANPKNAPCACSQSPTVSIFKTVDACEYPFGNVELGSYGLMSYVSVGLANGPFLWLGAASLNSKAVAPIVPLIVSPIWNDPVTLNTSKSLGITSIPPMLSKNG